jgi:uncharacterized membrane protein YbhN (UPF0104 family)
VTGTSSQAGRAGGVRLLRIGRWFLLALIIAFIADYLRKNSEALAPVREIGGGYLVALIALSLVYFAVTGLALRKMVAPFNVDLREHFQLSLASSFLNLVLPMRGGAFLRALYLSKVHGLTYAAFLASLFAHYVLVVLVNSFFALVVAGIVAYTEGHLAWKVGVTFVAILTAAFAASIGRLPERLLPAAFVEAQRDWWAIRRRRDVVAWLSGFAFVQTLIYTVITLVAFSALGAPATVLQATFLASVGSLAVLLSLTPGSLGVMEALFFLSATVLGIDPAASLVAALLIRATQALVLLFAGLPSYYLLARRLGGSSQAPGEHLTEL